MAKLGTQITHTETVKGVTHKFIFQHLGVRETFKLLSSNTDNEERITSLLDSVIKKEDGSRMTWEDFEELEDGFVILNSVTAAAVRFLTGK